MKIIFYHKSVRFFLDSQILTKEFPIYRKFKAFDKKLFYSIKPFPIRPLAVLWLEMCLIQLTSVR